MKDLIEIRQFTGNFDLAVSKVPKELWDDKNACIITKFEIRLVDQYVNRRYDQDDEYVFVFEVRE